LEKSKKGGNPPLLKTQFFCFLWLGGAKKAGNTIRSTIRFLLFRVILCDSVERVVSPPLPAKGESLYRQGDKKGRVCAHTIYYHLHNH